MTVALIALACGLLTGTSPPDTADRACACAPGTEHYWTRTSAARAAEAYYPQAEEYCRKKNRRGDWVIHGHYILWGPNGERLEEGEYRDGRREGVWAFWLPSQLQRWRFVHGRIDSSEVVGDPHEFTIDFCACNRQWMGVPWGQGSDYWKVLGVEGDGCMIEIGGEVEMGMEPPRFFHVPRAVGRLTFRSHADFGALDFSPLAPYALPESSDAVRRARARAGFR